MCGQSRRVSAAIAVGLALGGGVGCGGHGRPALPDGQRDVLWEAEWSTPAEPDGQVQPLGMTQGEDGSLLITGYVHNTEQDRYEMLIQRRTADGALEWSKRYWLSTGDAHDYGLVIPAQNTSDGGICVAMMNTVLKLDSTGEVLWIAPMLTRPSNDLQQGALLLDLAPTADGGVLASYTQWYEGRDVAGKPDQKRVSANSAVLRFNQAGAAQWAFAAGTETTVPATGDVVIVGDYLTGHSFEDQCYLAGTIWNHTDNPDWPLASDHAALLMALAPDGSISWQGLWTPQNPDGESSSAGNLAFSSGRLFYAGSQRDATEAFTDTTVGVFTPDGALLRQVRLGKGSALGDSQFIDSPAGPVLLAGFHETSFQTTMPRDSPLPGTGGTGNTGGTGGTGSGGTTAPTPQHGSAQLFAGDFPALESLAPHGASSAVSKFAFRDVMFFELRPDGEVGQILRRNSRSPLAPLDCAIDGQGNYAFLSELPEDDPLLNGWVDVDWPVYASVGEFVPSVFQTYELHPLFLEGLEVEVADCAGVGAGSPQFDPAQGVIGLHKVAAP